ncbi:unnamed protein product, partial [Rotaria sp. Silwood2]
YLLKPDFMRRPDRTFDPYAESPVVGVIVFVVVAVVDIFVSNEGLGADTVSVSIRFRRKDEVLDVR